MLRLVLALDFMLGISLAAVRGLDQVVEYLGDV
jgi:hypothetical protein